MKNLSFSDKIEVIKRFKNRINISAACARVGYTSQTYRNALYRQNNAYTNAEIAAVEAVYSEVCGELKKRREKGIAV